MMARKDTVTAVALVGLGVAGTLAYLATRSAGPVPMTKYTECREGPLQEHLVTPEELGLIPAAPRHHYPPRVAPNVTDAVNRGFAPLWQLPDPQAAALPAEAMW